VTFINEVVNDNFGFSGEAAVEPDPDQVAKAADDFKRLKSKLSIARATESAGLSLLDVGCGVGTFLLQAQREGWKVSGLELSPSVAAYARERNGLDVSSISIESTTKFSAQSLDVITLFGVIEHLANPRRAVDECARILRPSGFLVLQTPAEDGMIRRLGRFLYWASGGLVRFQVKQLYQMHGGHSVCFNRRSIRELLSRHGFEVRSIEASTYGIRLLQMRFRRMPFLKRLIYGFGTFVVFSLGQVLGSNHMTVYAQKRSSETVAK
jgi:2-polyprenyl-3-methyl-5-hydroxy-6-metoxy-1,4-benzoquinol methylase